MRRGHASTVSRPRARYGARDTARVIIEGMRGGGGALREITSLVVGPDESVLVSIDGRGGMSFTGLWTPPREPPG